MNLLHRNYNYNAGYNKINNSMLDGPQYLYPEGGNVISTVDDLHKWNHKLYNDIFKYEKTFEIFSKVRCSITPENFNNHYGFGISKTCDNPLEFSHTGWVYGYQSTVLYYPSVRCALDTKINIIRSHI